MFKAKHNIAREIMKELLKAVLIESVQSKASGPHIRQGLWPSYPALDPWPP